MQARCDHILVCHSLSTVMHCSWSLVWAKQNERSTSDSKMEGISRVTRRKSKGLETKGTEWLAWADLYPSNQGGGFKNHLSPALVVKTHISLINFQRRQVFLSRHSKSESKVAQLGCLGQLARSTGLCANRPITIGSYRLLGGCQWAGRGTQGYSMGRPPL